MSRSVNKVILIGHLGKDADIRYTPSGVPVAKFSLATNERFKAKGGDWQDRTEWHNVVAWRHLAEIVGEYVQKGSRIYVEGRLETSSWEDKQSGEKKYRTEIVATEIVLLSGGREQNGPTAGVARNGHCTSNSGRNVVNQRNGHTDDDLQESGIHDEDIPF